MHLSPALLLRQFRNDPELRSCLVFFTGSFGIALVLASVLNLHLFCSALGLSVLLTCFGSPYYGYKAVFTVQAVFLGWVAGCAVAYSILISTDHPYHLLARYALIMAHFHFSEFVFTAITNRRSLQPDSFLLNHSTAYWIAAGASWAEFAIESYLFPSMKFNFISTIGIIMCIAGEIIRKMGMIHAGVGFTHRLALSKRPDHRLITTGIYSLLRHPGYTGWLLWSIGTQFIMCNPICIVAYAVVSWNFFNERIYDEERDLTHFFGVSYSDYQQNVWIGIPFVKGYDITSRRE